MIHPNELRVGNLILFESKVISVTGRHIKLFHEGQLRESLTDNYERMKAGKMPLGMGKELANTAGKVINSVKIELEYQTLMKTADEIDFLKVDKSD
jgi:hypothetical protein